MSKPVNSAACRASRRDFLKTGGAAFGAAALGSLALGRSAMRPATRCFAWA